MPSLLRVPEPGGLDALRAVSQRVELHLSLGAKELTLNKLLEMQATQSNAYPSRAGATAERLAEGFGALWSQIPTRVRDILVIVETLYDEMSEHETADPSALVVGLGSALEVLAAW